jgi:hypothetical protein
MPPAPATGGKVVFVTKIASARAALPESNPSKTASRPPNRCLYNSFMVFYLPNIDRDGF